MQAIIALTLQHGAAVLVWYPEDISTGHIKIFIRSVKQKQCKDSLNIFNSLMNYWSEVQPGYVSHTSPNYSLEMAANPPPPPTSICPPSPYPVKPSTPGLRLMLNASLTEQYKRLQHL